MLDTVRERASAVGSTANTVVEGVTQVVATAAGVVVGTVEAFSSNNAKAREDEERDGGGAGETDVMDESAEYGEADGEGEEGEPDDAEDDDDDDLGRAPEVSGM
jgi:hypothetical protein